MKLYRLALLVALLSGFMILNSCNDDSDVSVLTIHINATALTPTGSTATYANYIVLSNENGDPVLTQEIKNDEAYDLKVPSYSDSTFILTQIVLNKVQGFSTMRAYTYVGIPAVDLTWTKIISSVATSSSDMVRIAISGYGSSINQAYISTTKGFRGIGSNWTPLNPGSVDLQATKPTFLFAIANDVSLARYKYKLYNNNGSGYTDNINVALGELTTEVSFKTLQIPSGIINTGLNVSGIIKNGVGAGSYYMPFSFGTRVPDFGTTFDDYLYSFVFTIGNNNYTNTSYTNVDMTVAPILLTNVQRTKTSLTYTASGTRDYESVSFRLSQTSGGANSGFWYIYAPAAETSKTLELPQMPAEITALWPNVDKAKFELDDFGGAFTAVDLIDIGSYADFVTKESLSGNRRMSIGISRL